MATYLATVAIGHYDITRTTTKNGLPVYVAVDPQEAAASRKVLAQLPEIMEWEEYNFGPYPFSSTGAIVDRGGDAGYALETQNRPFFPGAPDTATLVHELAHQWYGDSVTPKTWRDMWLNEGFATYAEWLWAEDHDGDTAQQTFDALYKGTYFDDKADDDAVWAFPPATPTSAAHISDSPRLRTRRDGPPQDPPHGRRRPLLRHHPGLGGHPPPRQRQHGRLHGLCREDGPGQGLQRDLEGLVVRARETGPPLTEVAARGWRRGRISGAACATPCRGDRVGGPRGGR